METSEIIKGVCDRIKDNVNNSHKLHNPDTSGIGVELNIVQRRISKI